MGQNKIVQIHEKCTPPSEFAPVNNSNMNVTKIHSVYYVFDTYKNKTKQKPIKKNFLLIRHPSSCEHLDIIYEMIWCQNSCLKC